MQFESASSSEHDIFNSLRLAGDVRVESEKRNENARRLSFSFDDVVVSIRVLLNDESGSDLVITNMTVLLKTGSKDMTGSGYGSKALEHMLSWAKEQGMLHIRASQVSSASKGFWEKNGFIKAPEPNPTGDYLLDLQ